MTEPMTPERADELRRRYPSLKFVGEMADEIGRLRGAYERLAACVGSLDFDRSESALPETQEQWIEFVRELDDRAQALIEKDYEQ